MFDANMSTSLHLDGRSFGVEVDDGGIDGKPLLAIGNDLFVSGAGASVRLFLDWKQLKLTYDCIGIALSVRANLDMLAELAERL